MSRASKFTSLLILWLGGTFALGYAVAKSVKPADYLTYEDYRQAVNSNVAGARVLVVLALLLVFGFVCKRIGYRPRDTFLLVIPFAGMYFFFKFMWRWASLPKDRYWAGAPNTGSFASPGMYEVPGQPGVLMFWDGSQWSGQMVPFRHEQQVP
jgi:hypothetical protein